MSAMKLGKATCIRETDGAVLCEGPHLKGEVWIPKSVLHDDSEVYDAGKNSTGTLVVKDWWAEKNTDRFR